MDITIVKGSKKYIKDCEGALLQSELGRRYFSAEGSVLRALEEGFEKKEIFVALNENQQCVGFLWYILNGVFHSFPYLHIIAVKKECRCEGVGAKLMDFFEENCFKDSSKAFLVVADFNPKAKKLYERLGYTQVGTLPNLYREGITEYLMMKVKP